MRTEAPKVNQCSIELQQTLDSRCNDAGWRNMGRGEKMETGWDERPASRSRSRVTPWIPVAPAAARKVPALHSPPHRVAMRTVFTHCPTVTPMWLRCRSSLLIPYRYHYSASNWLQQCMALLSHRIVPRLPASTQLLCQDKTVLDPPLNRPTKQTAAACSPGFTAP